MSTQIRVGFVNKYENRTVATHALTEAGLPACGARVDRDALEDFEAPASDVTCVRCARKVAPARR